MSSEKAMRRVGTSLMRLEGAPHPARARDLAEGADMRQARRPIAGFEQHAFDLFARLARAVPRAATQLARFLERPGPRGKRLFAKRFRGAVCHRERMTLSVSKGRES